MSLMTKDDKAENRELKRLFGGWWMWIIGLLLVTMLVLGVMRGAGLVGYTALERLVYEQSYQKQAADNKGVNVFTAQLAEIETKLLNPNLDENTRYNLEAQKSTINVQLSALRGEK